ncbi:MAG: tetratricopeptide (TPR) repeat protein [Planctomycetota bacterium]
MNERAFLRSGWRGILLAALLPFCATGLAACSAQGEALFPSFIAPGPYDELSDRAWARVIEARNHWDAGEMRLARADLRFIADEFPRNLNVGVLLQELELDLLRFGIALPDLGLTSDDVRSKPDEGPAMLRRYYREQAETGPTPESLVLAARLESDLPAAESLLKRAIELDEKCAWAHYGAAHVAYRNGKFLKAKEHLERQASLDPRLLPARRLRARVLMTTASAEAAAPALDRWLKDASQSPFVSLFELAMGQFDLALLLVQTEEYDRVEELCAVLLRDGFVDSTSVYLVLAATRVADDRAAEALDAARRASRTSPTSTLAHVQRALILEEWMAEPDKAFDAWSKALEAAEGGTSDDTDVGGRPQPETVRDAQFWLFARTRLARLQAAREAAELSNENAGNR